MSKVDSEGMDAFFEDVVSIMKLIVIAGVATTVVTVLAAVAILVMFL